MPAGGLSDSKKIDGSARVSLEILPDDKAPPSKTKAPSW
jgi:hypothetical protein